MGGRGADFGFEQMKAMQRNITSLKRNTSRLQRIYYGTSGAVIAYDHRSGSQENYIKAVNQRDAAYKKYKESQDKLDRAQKKMDRIQRRRNRRVEDVPFF